MIYVSNFSDPFSSGYCYKDQLLPSCDHINSASVQQGEEQTDGMLLL